MSINNRVQRRRGPHNFVDEERIGLEVATNVLRRALNGVELVDEGRLGRGELVGDGGELGGEVGVVGLSSEGGGPKFGEIVVRAAVVERVNLALRRLALDEESAGGGVEQVRSARAVGPAYGVRVP